MSDLQSLIDAQVKSMTELHLRVKELTADVAMYKERMEYWENRARSFEEDARNIIPATFKAWWAMIEAECYIQQEPLEDSAIALNYMGHGASCHVTAGEIRDMLGCKTDDTLQELRAHGLEDHLDGGNQDA